MKRESWKAVLLNESRYRPNLAKTAKIFHLEFFPQGSPSPSLSLYTGSLSKFLPLRAPLPALLSLPEPSQSSPSKASSGAADTRSCASRCTWEPKSSVTSSLIWATPDNKLWKGSVTPGASQGTRSCCRCPSSPTYSPNSSIATATLQERATVGRHRKRKPARRGRRRGEGRGLTSVCRKSLLPLPSLPAFGIGVWHRGPASSGPAPRGRFSRLRRGWSAVRVTVEDGRSRGASWATVGVGARGIVGRCTWGGRGTGEWGLRRPGRQWLGEVLLLAGGRAARASPPPGSPQPPFAHPPYPLFSRRPRPAPRGGPAQLLVVGVPIPGPGALLPLVSWAPILTCGQQDAPPFSIFLSPAPDVSPVLAPEQLLFPSFLVSSRCPGRFPPNQPCDLSHPEYFCPYFSHPQSIAGY